MTSRDGLLPEEYQAVVAPAIRAVVDLAAARGDPYLYNDLGCMLTLMFLIRELADLYQNQWEPMGQISSPELFSEAPIAAVVMVLQEFDIEPRSIRSMRIALERAYQEIASDGVFGPERTEIQKAWDARVANKEGAANTFMCEAATATVSAIDAWEARRNACSN
ncbi:MAG TPA: hypothetical protein DGR97_04215 [Gammaproteobacteria bacterium]|nr:hypothetical protein [Gammaproteobacteria bacterium]|tara:strand:- start:347 stop:838 length:492 start_codon:yes stop_codon:yes gene_type:complete